MSTKQGSPSKNSMTEAGLLEQIRLLTIENKTLRTIIAKNSTANVLQKGTKENGAATQKRTRSELHMRFAEEKSLDSPTASRALVTGGKGCSCKGNCSTRVCGCIKKNVPCSELCRCGDELCQNSEPNKENIGDSNNSAVSNDGEENLSKLSKLILGDKEESKKKPARFNPVNKRIEKATKARKIFSPEVTEDVSTFEDGVREMEFENLSLQFSEHNETEAGKSTKKDRKSDRVKANATKKSKNQKNKKAENIKAKNTRAAEKQDDRLDSIPSSEEVSDDVERETRKKTMVKVKRKVKVATRKQDNQVDLAEIDEGDQESELLEPEPTAKGKGKTEKKGRARTAMKRRNKRTDSEEIADEGSPVRESPEPEHSIKNKKKTGTKATGAARKRNHRLNSEEKDQAVPHDDKQSESDAEPANENEKKAAGVTRKQNNRINSKQKDSENAAKVQSDQEEPVEMGNSSFETETLLNLEATGNFNPMKPRRQLSRSPIGPYATIQSQRILDPSEIFLPVPVEKELDEEKVPPPAELEKAIVDWDEHQANLVKCSKCSRTFHPHRIKKHETFCQQI